MSHLTLEEAAIIAAAQATRATHELLQFYRDGAHSGVSAFENDVVCMLAESLKLALEIEDTPQAKAHLDDDELAQLDNLKGAVCAFIEGWVG